VSLPTEAAHAIASYGDAQLNAMKKGKHALDEWGRPLTTMAAQAGQPGRLAIERNVASRAAGQEELNTLARF
jgi:hypothetical protein